MRQTWSNGTRVVAAWSVEHLLWSPRTLVMAAVAASLPALALVLRVLTAAGLDVPVSGFGFFSILTATVGFQFVAPMLALVYSSGVIIDELEAGTLTYLVTRATTRATILTGKLVGSYLIQALLLLPSLVLCFYLAVAPSGWQELGARFPVLARDIGAALLGLAAYSGLFGLAGAVLRRPVLAGLIFVFGYQAVATYVPGLVRQLTVAHYLQSLLPHESFQGALSGFVGGRASTAAAVAVLASIAAAAHGLAALIFSRREFPGRE